MAAFDQLASFFVNVCLHPSLDTALWIRLGVALVVAGLIIDAH